MTVTIHHPRCDISTHNGLNVRCVGEQSHMLSVMKDVLNQEWVAMFLLSFFLADILIKQY